MLLTGAFDIPFLFFSWLVISANTLSHFEVPVTVSLERRDNILPDFDIQVTFPLEAADLLNALCAVPLETDLILCDVVSESFEASMISSGVNGFFLSADLRR